MDKNEEKDFEEVKSQVNDKYAAVKPVKVIKSEELKPEEKRY